LDRLASEIQPTLIAVLSDINMPALDGLQLLGEIMQRSPDLPGHDCNCRRDDERSRKASELGAADFLVGAICAITSADRGPVRLDWRGYARA
jgi:DNA-binding NtrC family response regulator